MWNAAMDLNRSNILQCVPRRPDLKLVDLGCDDGVWTMQLAAQAGTTNVWGVEIVPERAAAAEQRGVRVARSDLAKPLPFADGSFDLLHANQVIEHVPDIDLFVSEIARVLRPRGRAILSTENGSSWVNIGASVLGWQIFSLTNVSAKRLGIGNPFALHRGERGDLPSWTHKTIFNFRGLKELCESYGLVDARILGAGYFPLPARLGTIDPRHAHFITLTASKQ
jgi:SAM-dependent methyltransferase